IMVPQECVQRIPYTTCRMISEQHCKMVVCKRCLMVPEVCVRHIPYTTCRTVPEQHCKMVTCRRCVMVPEVCVQRIPYTTCRMVPVMVPVCEPSCPAPVSETSRVEEAESPIFRTSGKSAEE